MLSRGTYREQSPMLETRRTPIDCKMILLGAQGVGKTCLVNAFVNKAFSNQNPTVGALFSSYLYKDVNIGIWDTAGSDRYDAVSSFYCRGAATAILVYDITDESSFALLSKYHHKLLQATKEPMILVLGTKSDLVRDNVQARQVYVGVGKQYADSIGAHFSETSAKDFVDVSDVFHRFIDKFREKTRNEPRHVEISIPSETPSPISVSHPPPTRAEKPKCEC
eukprot:TRINITY_DN8282_c0_g1_i1.p1 TRINITY_DN8282_c0_g1~~TRINITY_DN8282_c0_g1_i1.p1  ORF type:complete len:222 (-),score=47.19 TRINITY_DN8282_c0_g1_i1:144-809(-)